jgi:hypothetical protein
MPTPKIYAARSGKAEEFYVKTALMERAADFNTMAEKLVASESHSRMRIGIPTSQRSKQWHISHHGHTALRLEGGKLRTGPYNLSDTHLAVFLSYL